jgi:hypothetical protein
MHSSPVPTSSKSTTATTPSSSSSTTSQSSIPIPTVSPTSDCSNGSTYQSIFQNGFSGPVLSSAGLTFTKLCSTEQDGFPLASAYVYTFEDCIEVCAGLNFFNGDRQCLGVSYEATGIRPANCWAHNDTTQKSSTTADAAVLEA